MTQKPPSGPESDDLFKLAQAHVQALRQVTQEIQLQTQLPDIPTLNQLVFQRDEVIKALTQLDLPSLPEAQQAELAAALQDCQDSAPEIEGWLLQMRDRLEQQVRGVQAGKKLIDKYKIDDPQASGQNFRDA